MKTGISELAAQLVCFYVAYGLASGCPVKPRGPTKMFRGHCYEFVAGADVYHTEAVQSCSSRGAHLVHVKDKETQTWITGVFTELGITQGVWLGLQRKRGDKNEWLWDTVDSLVQGEDTALDWSQWFTNEPDMSENRLCARFGNPTATGFDWVASVCDFYPYDYPYVCQYDGTRRFFGRYENVIAICVASIFLVVCSVATGIFIRNCYRKRKALIRQLGHNSSSIKEQKKSNIEAQSISSGDVRNIMEVPERDRSSIPRGTPPPHYAPVSLDEEDMIDGFSNYNFNILIGNCRSPMKPVHTKNIDITPTRSCSMIEHTTPMHQDETTPVLRSQSLVEPERPNDLAEDSQDEEMLAVASSSSQSVEAIEECSSLLEIGADQLEASNTISEEPHINLEDNVGETTPLHSDITPLALNDLS